MLSGTLFLKYPHCGSFHLVDAETMRLGWTFSVHTPDNAHTIPYAGVNKNSRKESGLPETN